MKIRFLDKSIAVLDDFLNQDLFMAVWNYVQRETYRVVHQPTVKGVWRIEDSWPMRGPIVLANSIRDVADYVPPLPDHPCVAPTLGYPTRSAIDPFITKVLRAAHQYSRLVGKEKKEWEYLSASAFVYPAGTGLSWHWDADIYSGAFIYYAHPEWNVRWGGELLVADIPPPSSETRPRKRTSGGHKNMIFQNLEENRLLMDKGMGMFFQPAPNRLIFIRGGTPHRISPVTPAAGDKVRASLAGFFIRCAAAAKTKNELSHRKA